MGLRKDFLVHKRKTVESFRFVKEDISNVNNGIENLKSMLNSLESRIFNEVSALNKAIDNNLADINSQKNHNFSIQSKIESISKSISNSLNTINSLNNGVKNLLFKQHQIVKNISSQESSITKLFAMSKSQSLKEKQLNSAFKKSQEEIKKLRSFVNKRLGVMQRKISGKKSSRASRKIAPRKRITKALPKKIKTETSKKKIVEVIKTKKPLM